ncbi:MAG: PLP-dependent aminotransferase family protein [Rhizobiaceae bacterium]
MTEPSNSHLWEPKYASRIAKMRASEIRELLKLLERPEIISFAGGIPDPALFPVEEIRSAYQAVLANAENAGRVLQYSISEGDPELRKWIVGYMASKGIKCDVENILITNGSQQGLEFLGKLLLSPNDTALVEAPTYLGALQAFSANEPVYDELKLENTNRTAGSYSQSAAEAGGEVKFAYVVPDFSNPSGETLGLQARRNLLQLADELDVPVIEDSPYSELRYDGKDVRAIQALDVETCGSLDASRVIHCGTFSKTFTPGLRVGWICASRQIIGRLTLIKQAGDLNSSAINQSVMLHLAEELFDGQVETACNSYRLKRDAMLKALKVYMPDGVKWSKPEGGLFVWVTLPEELNASDLLKKSVSEAKVAFVPGHAFFADDGGHNTMRLSFSLPAIETIEVGIKRLGALVKAEIMHQ